MKSLYGLEYVELNLDNIDIAYKIQKETWPKDPDYEDLYDKVMQLKEKYTLEDTKTSKTNTLIYSYSLNGKLDLWNNRYLGLREYYDSMKCKGSDKNVI